MEDILAIVLIFGGGTACAIAFSPIGRAIAERIRGRSAGGADADALADHRDQVEQELEQMRGQMAELAERVDFAERLLAKQRDAQRVGPGQ